MTIQIGSTIEKLDPGDPYKLMSGQDVEGFDELKTQADNTKRALDPIATTDLPAAKQAIASLQKLVDNSIETVGLTSQNQLIVTTFKGDKNLIKLPDPGTGPNVDKLKTEIQSVEQTLKQQGTDVEAIRQQYGAVDHKVEALGAVYTYSGTASPPPVIPADKTYHSYFLSLRPTGSTAVTVDMPNPTDPIQDGTAFHLSNNGKVEDIVLQPPGGVTINSQVNFTVRHGTFVFLIKNGTDWFLVTEGLTTARDFTLTANMISNAVNQGTAPNSGSIKSLADGWWFIPVENTALSGRPSGSQGDLNVFIHSVTSGDQSQFRTGIAFGQDSRKDPAMWIIYRGGKTNTWTKWEKLDDGDSGDISAITADINALKNGNAGMLQRLSNLETSLGNIYAPTQSAFDVEANKLIDAALAEFKQKLIGEGWGPLSNIPGGDRPLPSGIPKIWAYYGLAFPTSLGAAGQASSTSGVVSLTRGTTDNQRIFIIVPNDKNQADDVSGISVDGGTAAKWQSRDVTLDSKPYRVFYSPGAYVEQANTVHVLFGNQG